MKKFIPAHGGYEKLLSFQKARIVYDGTVWFCKHYLEKRDRTYDQMVQAARSGKQNILEGSQASGTSKATEIKLTNVARASLEELLEDYRDFLRVRGLRLWDKDARTRRSRRPPAARQSAGVVDRGRGRSSWPNLLKSGTSDEEAMMRVTIREGLQCMCRRKRACTEFRTRRPKTSSEQTARTACLTASGGAP